jgi:hypothetical protein
MNAAGPQPVRYVVAERRPWTGAPAWIFGDEWNAWCDSLEEAAAVADRWRTHPGTDAADIAVFAVVPAEGEVSA